MIGSMGLAKERGGSFSIKIEKEFKKAPKKVGLWIPYPGSDEFQEIKNVKVNGNTDSFSVYREPKTKMLYLYSQWEGKLASIEQEISFDVKARERRVEKLRDRNLPVPHEIKKYLASNRWIPTGGKIAKTANQATKGKKGILAKSRAIYDWVVENTCRDPKVIGCGLGSALNTLEKRGGKCADISSLYVALARAAGVPAREVFGLRLGKKKKQDMTKGFHCWAEFYLPGTGWVQVDPADVRKLMLVKKLNLKQAKKYREYYFGAVDPYRIALAKDARGITFYPAQAGEALSYFMYPYAEVDGKPLDYLNPSSFKYSVEYKKIN